jgi:hypothetical protein
MNDPMGTTKTLQGIARRVIPLAAVLLTMVGLVTSPAARAAEPIVPAVDPPEPHFNRLYDYEEITGLLRGYTRAYPDWVELESIGKSAEGRDMWLLTVNNPATGDDLSKPALYIDGNIHANEVQGAETALYTVDFVLENYGRLDRVTELLDRAAIYVIPMVNPDGRARWFEGPSTANFPRTVMVPVDDDRDGLADEDGYDDLDGDGVITQMRKKVPPGAGGFRLDPEDPRVLVEAEEGKLGDYVPLGPEGVDNDGDGQVNEDQVGYVDPNRTWGYFWQPRYVQAGAGDYPLQIPETRSIALWALDHPNIGAVQSYHNSGGMILRGPGSKLQPDYPVADIRVYDLIGEEGEKLLPGYDYFVTWEDLYTVYGDTTDHFYNVHGAIALTNELYDDEAEDFDGDGEVSDEELMKFNDVLTLGRQFVEWHEVEHPQYGTVEVGGYRQDVGRIPEGWMLEEEIHRNNAFVLFHAHHLPKIGFGEPKVERLEGDLWRVEVPVVNERGIPTVTALAAKNKLHRPDVATVAGAEVVSSGLVQNSWLDRVEVQEHRPERLMVPGVDPFSTRTLFFLLKGSGEITVTYDSLKGGTIETTFRLAE